ncbi:4'-phosphopantetheinyl transferase family protein [Thermocatellispora tengchongensis]|uniref:4'-phosphopantetheinyl transferase family protein n=1 Tax=Thermocatellispora tengchongensis TaxID=1073253 RepID=UPI00362E6A92
MDDKPFPGEEEAIARAVPKRRDEYVAARACARRALAELGIAPVPILSGPKREPLWPPGVVGSITHCDGYRAAAVARDDVLVSVGIDAEPHAPLPDGVYDAIARPEEAARLPALRAADPSICWDRLLFCAKEAIYKAWYPVTGRWLGFEDALVTPAADGTFTVRILVPAPPPLAAPPPGRWLARDGLLLAALSLPAT